MTGDSDAISVIIPALNEASCIGRLLERLSGMDFVEIIVADGGSSDRTVDIARLYPRVSVIRHQGGRGPLLNAGARNSRGRLLFFLHADTIPPALTPHLIRNTLASPGVAGGCFRLRFDSPAVKLLLFSWASRFETGLTTFGDQGYFTRRADFDAVGGFPEWPLLEDVEFRRQLKSRGHFVKLEVPVITSARRFIARGPLKAQLENFSILMAYHTGAPAEKLARRYRRSAQ